MVLYKKYTFLFVFFVIHFMHVLCSKYSNTDIEKCIKSILNKGSINLKSIEECPQLIRADIAIVLSSILINSREYSMADSFLNYANANKLKTINGAITGKVYYNKSFISEYFKQNIQDALADLNLSIDTFSALKNKDLLLPAIKRKFDVEHTHGFLNAAVQTCRLLLKSLPKKSIDYTYYEVELGMVLQKLGQNPEALDLAHDAVSKAEKLKSELCIPRAKKLLGILYEQYYNYDSALALYSDAYQGFSKTGDFHEAANCLYNSGMIYSKLKNFTSSRSYYERAILFFTKAGSLTGVGMCKQIIGLDYIELKEYQISEKLFFEAENEFRLEKSYFQLALIKTAFALLYSKKNEINLSKKYAKEAIDIYMSTGDNQAAEKLRSHYFSNPDI